MDEKLPQLVIIPHSNDETFELVIKSTSGDTPCGIIKSIKWLAPRTWVDYPIRRPVVSAPNKIKNLPSGFNKKQFVVLGAKHYFGETEFTTKELLSVLKESYPKLNMKLSPGSIASILSWSRKFDSIPHKNPYPCRLWRPKI